MTGEHKTILAIDPGRSKCGVAVVRGGTQPEVAHRAVVPTERIGEVVGELSACHSPDVILIGGGTTASSLAATIRALGLAVEIVDERLSSIEARRRYFKENPPRGLRRLIPTSLQTPGQPVDDYAAVILAERYLASP